MSELALRAPLHQVSPRARWYWAVRALPSWLALLVVEVVLWAAIPGSPATHAVLLTVTTLAAAAHLLVMPQWRYRVHRWEVTPTAVYTQAGWFTQERRIAPIDRVQTVDTHRGPLEQLFGLANVTVTTASAAGPLHIRGLPAQTAEAVAHELTARTDPGGDGT